MSGSGDGSGSADGWSGSDLGLKKGDEFEDTFFELSGLTCDAPTPPPLAPTPTPASCCVGEHCQPPAGDEPGASKFRSKYVIAIVAAAVVGLGLAMLVGAKCLRGGKKDSPLDNHLLEQSA